MTELDYRRLALDLVLQHLETTPWSGAPERWASRVVESAEKVFPIIRDYLRAKPVPTKM